MSELPHEARDDDPTVETSLSRGLSRQPLDAAAFARIRAAAAAEWAECYERRASELSRRIRIARRLALAAAILVAVLIGIVNTVHRPPEVVVGSVLRTEQGTLESGRLEWLPHHAMTTGAPLRAGDRYTSLGATLIALARGGTLRVAPGSAFEATTDEEIVLSSGRVYLDFPRGGAGFIVRTSAGTVEHIGTQFEVATLASGMRVRVREGSVSVHTVNGVHAAEAGTELVVYADQITERPLATHGPEWDWVAAITPGFDIEDRPVAEFLSWVARETGRRIVFADDLTRERAIQTRLHGSISGLAPLEALERVLATTTLRCDVQADVIRVSSIG